MERLMSITEASELLGLKITTLYKYVSNRKIPHIKLGKRILFDPNSIKKWVEERSVPIIR